MFRCLGFRCLGVSGSRGLGFRGVGVLGFRRIKFNTSCTMSGNWIGGTRYGCLAKMVEGFQVFGSMWIGFHGLATIRFKTVWA